MFIRVVRRMKGFGMNQLVLIEFQRFCVYIYLILVYPKMTLLVLIPDTIVLNNDASPGT